MSRTKKKYSVRTKQPGIAHQMRGGTPGQATDTGFGAKGNLRRSQKRYKMPTGIPA